MIFLMQGELEKLAIIFIFRGKMNNSELLIYYIEKRQKLISAKNFLNYFFNLNTLIP